MPYIKSIRRNFENLNKAEPSTHFDITGGDKVITAGGYRIHFFTTVGEHQFVVKPKDYLYNSNMAHLQSGNLLVEYLCIAGGGAGGSNANICSGGGAGGFLQGTTHIPVGTNSFTVGGGAPLATTQGTDSSLNGIIIAKGGGSGNVGENGGDYPTHRGQRGGSGGGESYNNIFRSNASGIAGQGTNGGSGDAQTSVHSSGGGGGAGGHGENGWNPFARGGLGGPGLSTSISGTATAYAGGGGGGSWSGGNTSPGGSGGGGNGSGGNDTGAATVGTANTGGGGGGGYNNGNSKTGGSGIIIARYRV
jgi:hypothetical protein